MHKELNNEKLLLKILSNFDKNFNKLNNTNLSYKLSRFFSKDIDLFDYSNKNKNFIFYKDKNGVETHISIYKSIDKLDNSEGIIMELIIGETKQKDIMFFSEGKIYNIIQNKWGKILNTNIIKEEKFITNILKYIDLEINYINSKVISYQNKLRVKGLLTKTTNEEKVENFKNIFKQNILIG